MRTLAIARVTLVACASLLGAFALNAASAWEADKSYEFTLLHTNDHHGRFWPNRHGEYGLAARKTLVDNIRAEVSAAGGHALLLSGGDINTGVPESDLQDAAPDFKAMNMLGYDAMAVGNHEFDNELPVIRKQEGWADFPFLSANIYDESSGKRLFLPYQMFDLGELKVAVVGFTTEDTQKLGNPEFMDGIVFTTPVAEAAKLIPGLRKRADLVIAVTHMGHYQNAAYGINAPGDVTLARRVLGIDIIIGGHSQDPVCMESRNKVIAEYQAGNPCTPDIQNDTYIMQAHEWGKYVGRADFVFRNGALDLRRYELIPVNLKKKVTNAEGESVRVLIDEEIVPDASVASFLQPFQDQGQAELQTRIGRVDAKLVGDRDVVRFRATNLGHLIATAQMGKVGGDLAVMNSGGIRDSIEAGDITYKDVLKVQPFANAVAFVELTGTELQDYLAAVAAKPIDSGAFAQFAGVQLDIEAGALASARVNGKAIDPAATYRLAINSYIAAGGDKYPRMDNHPNYVNTGFVDADVLTEYIRKNSPINAAEHDVGDVMRR
ncbi:MAG: bifunctional UDP-sugar hydrolase/5'-nucleotidase UshA [Gammaproteobacteria bacterium]|nr:bifunctional UDP-sugar hydrolase/5'-nucleotidase UshA [Gammaproteobacteria bacterium]